MFNPMNGYPQPMPWPQHQGLSNVQYQGHQHGPSQKRAKTNTGMVTTKYAPPPGYVPPASHAASHPVWPQAAPSYAGMYTSPYPQQHPGYAAYQFNHAQQQYQHPVNYAQQMLLHSQSHPVTAPHTAHPAGTTAQWPQPWNQASIVPPHDESALRQRHNSMPDLGSNTLPNVNETVRRPDKEPQEGDEDFCEFTRPCFFAEREGDVQKEFSLGLIVTKTALPSNKPLPATWDEANTQALAPPGTAQAYQAGECISRFHASDQTEELESVRSTSMWKEVEHDLIFRSFPRVARDLTRHHDWIAQYRARDERHRRVLKVSDTKEEVSKKRSIMEDTDREGGGEGEGERKRPRQRRELSEQSASGELTPKGNASIQGVDDKVDEKPQESQEEVLARLGVTGAPKPVSSQMLNGVIGISTPPPEQAKTVQDLKLDPTGSDKVKEKASSKAVEASTNITNATIEIAVTTAKWQDPTQVKPPANESRWTRLAREYQTGEKRPYDG